MAEATTDIRQWLVDFSAAVRAVDYERGMTMFAPDVVGFGTYASMLEGLEPLVAGQWRNIWGVTRGFAFRLEQVHCGVDGDLAWVAAPWDSQGRTAGGDWYDRPGRATLVLQRRDGRWLCIHSHLSLYPRPTDQPGR
ncbi:MAG: nuclear transport factor 2 family protein [Chloroflexi bacterium]|nr:nuclear transport factor 2 family protein [Chloroflexota bacterium]